MKKHSIILLIALSCLYYQCAPNKRTVLLIDPLATTETKALYAFLKESSKSKIMFGHEDTDAYGIGWWADAQRSDVKDIVGDYPAVHGWDLGDIHLDRNLDSVSFADMHRWISDTHTRGGINTISWHLDNPINGNNSWDQAQVVDKILPGAAYHQNYLNHLDKIADFLANCKSGNTLIPIIFRPFHEHNGDWFWWGKGHCSEEDYIQLWRFTVDYLKNKKGLHHLIYAFSPDRSRMGSASSKEDYLYAYPGDDYVDLIGFDNYWDVGRVHNTKSEADQKQDFVKGLKLITRLAKEKNKVAALTETGSLGLQYDDWYSRFILDPIKTEKDSIEIAYFLVWRNFDREGACAPYLGHPAANDFNKFYQDDLTLFESDLQSIYIAPNGK